MVDSPVGARRASEQSGAISECVSGRATPGRLSRRGGLSHLARKQGAWARAGDSGLATTGRVATRPRWCAILALHGTPLRPRTASPLGGSAQYLAGLYEINELLSAISRTSAQTGESGQLLTSEYYIYPFSRIRPSRDNGAECRWLSETAALWIILCG